jgi:hypothetical protein
MMNKKLLIVGGVLLVGGIAYAVVKPVDDFVNQFRFAITDYGIDFKKAIEQRNFSVPAHVTAALMNNEDFEPTIDSMVVTVFTQDDKKNWFELFSSQPSEPFKIARRTTTNKVLTFQMPLKSMGMDLATLTKRFLKGEKSKFRFQVNTIVKGQLLTEIVEKEF